MENTHINNSNLVSLESFTDEQLARKMLEWRRDPVIYFVERLGIPIEQIDEHEKTLLRALPKAIVLRKPVVVPSANAMGKDWTISGRASLWFYECFGPTCKVVMTGPTERQVIDIMWSELKNAYAKRPSDDEMGRLVTCKLEGSPEWFITAFTTKETANTQGKFQGTHSPRLMVVVSEAQAVDDIIYDQIEGLTMADICLQVYLGNPLVNTGRFASMIEDTGRNIVIRLDAYDCINVKSGRQVIPGLVSKAWVDDKEKLWNSDGTGKDPRYMARVRGLLPTTAINSVISRDLYKACVNRELSWWSSLYGVIGVDPALTGTDDMVITVMKSGKIIDEWVIPYNENETVAAGKIQIKLNEHFPDGGACVVIDSDGLGIKVAQAFRKMLPEGRRNFNKLIEYRGSCNDRKIVDPQYENTRAEAHFYAKQRMMDGHISLDDNDYAREEATSVLYFTNGRGRIQIEDKDDLKMRLNRSPNRWDSRVCAIWGFKYAEKIITKGRYQDEGSSGMRPTGITAMSA